MDWMNWKTWTTIGVILIAVFAIYAFARGGNEPLPTPASPRTRCMPHCRAQYGQCVATIGAEFSTRRARARCTPTPGKRQ